MNARNGNNRRQPTPKAIAVGASVAVTARQPVSKTQAQKATSAIRQPKSLRIILADDHVLIRELVAGMVSGKGPCCEVVAEAGTAAEAIVACEKHTPHLLVLDVNMPGRTGVDAVPDIKKVSPNTRILLCCGTITERDLLTALQAGADGFMEKTSSGAEFLNAIERVARGENYLCAKSINILSKVLQKAPGDASSTTERKSLLTAREKEIIGLIAGGQSSKEIATKLFLSLATVETHRANLMTKIQAHNVAQLVRYALDHGLVDPAAR